MKILHIHEEEELGEVLDMQSYKDESSLYWKEHTVPSPSPPTPCNK